MDIAGGDRLIAVKVCDHAVSCFSSRQVKLMLVGIVASRERLLTSRLIGKAKF